MRPSILAPPPPGPTISAIPQNYGFAPSEVFAPNGQLKIGWSQSSDVSIFHGPRGVDVSFRLRVVADCLICSLCGGFFRKAATLKECLHTFCRSCILRHLIQRRSSCPKCNISIEGNILDSLVSDERLQTIVDKLFPFFIEQDRKMKFRLVAYLSRQAASHDYSDSLKQHRIKQTTRLSQMEISNAIDAYRSQVWIKAYINPEPNCAITTRLLSQLKYPFFILPGDIPIGVLTEFIQEQLSQQFSGDLELWIGGEQAEAQLSLELACRSRRLTIGQASRPVNITYRVKQQTPEDIPPMDLDS